MKPNPLMSLDELGETTRRIIYIRHGEDTRSGYQYDEKLTKKGKTNSRKLAKELIHKYGVPDIIYCSPYYRTRQTRRQMLKVIKRVTDKKIDNITDPRLSRFFTRYEKRNPDIREDTLNKKAPIYETWNDFKRRVRKQVKHMERKDEYNVIWCIGHTLIIKEVAKIKQIVRSDHIRYLDTVVLEL